MIQAAGLTLPVVPDNPILTNTKKDKRTFRQKAPNRFPQRSSVEKIVHQLPRKNQPQRFRIYVYDLF